jgi:Beta-ketoacyl synthase, N-terminal domain
MQVCLAGQAVLAPGLPDWAAARDVLRGSAPYVPGPCPDPAPTLLPATERRRASASVRWALAVAQQALDGREADAVATVFASCGGDGMITHQICEALATPQGVVSPTRFHNSVHNAPAGYWSIATRSQAASTSLSGFEGSFAIGLLEAATQAAVERRSVLLVAYDLPYPEPMHALWPVAQPFAAGLLLDPPGTGPTTFRVALKPGASRTAWPPTIPGGFQSNPAAQALPLLAACLRAGPPGLELPYDADSHVAIEVSQ